MLVYLMIILLISNTPPDIFEDPEITSIKSGFENGEFILKAYIGRQIVYIARGSEEGGEAEGIWTIYGFEDIVSAKETDLPQKRIASGRCIGGKRDGEWKGFFDNEKVAWEGEYRDGLLTGVYTDYFETGQIRFQGSYNNGFKCGHWKYYHENGHVQVEGDYDNDLRTGVWSVYYPSEAKLWQCSYKIISDKEKGMYSVRDGEFKMYHKGGQLAQHGSYIQGNKEGKWIYFNHKGIKVIEGSFMKSKKEGGWIYYNTKGKKSRQIFFEKGKKIKEIDF
ncbi:MAG: hypothetical protein JXA60_00840 [Candidatus Coatesbacteria bacterium]|nr:hypothetical protein [Candidatus Coatesbacteria bacterium]